MNQLQNILGEEKIDLNDNIAQIKDLRQKQPASLTDCVVLQSRGRGEINSERVAQKVGQDEIGPFGAAKCLSLHAGAVTAASLNRLAVGWGAAGGGSADERSVHVCMCVCV